MTEQKRIEWIDLLKSFAIMLVILCHCSENVYRFSDIGIELMTTVSLTSRIFALTAFTAGRLGVPFFMLISGYLLLDREYDTDRTLRFWKNNWLRLLICVYVWFIIYYIYGAYVRGDTFLLKNVFKELLFLEGNSGMGHVWYMYMLLGMYPLFPYAANALRSVKPRATLFPVILFSLYALGVPFLNTLRRVVEAYPLPITLSMGFSGGTYGLYFVIGYLLKKGMLKRVKSWILIFLAMGTFIFTVCFQFWAYSRKYAYRVWYDNPFLAVSSIAIFELVSRIKYVPFSKVFKQIAYYSFALYLIHNMILYSALPDMLFPVLEGPVKTVVLWVLLMTLSLLTAWIIGHIPKIGKYILYLK